MMEHVEFELISPLGVIQLQVPKETQAARMICQYSVKSVIEQYVKIPRPVRPQWHIVVHDAQKGLFFRFEETVNEEVRYILTNDERFRNKIGVELHDAYLEDKKEHDYTLGNKP